MAQRSVGDEAPSSAIDLEAVCRDWGSAILRRCTGILRDRAEAEDAAQEVFLTILIKGHQFRGEASLSSWIYRLTTNLCLNRLRGDKRRTHREGSDAVVSWSDVAPVDPYAEYAAKDSVHKIVAELDDLGRAIFVHRYLDGMTQEEIAAATGKSRRTIGKRLQTIDVHIASHTEEAP